MRQIKRQNINPDSQSRLLSRTLVGLLVLHVRLIKDINWAFGKKWQKVARENCSQPRLIDLHFIASVLHWTTGGLSLGLDADMVGSPQRVHPVATHSEVVLLGSIGCNRSALKILVDSH